ncbi:MAG: glycosyltransferase [Acetobacteraceae bacterium]
MGDATGHAAAPLVVHVFPTFAVGGAQARFAALANQFDRAFRHIIVSMDGNMACQARLAPGLIASFPTVPQQKDAMLSNALRFRRLLRTWKPDLLVTCNWGAVEFALANRLLPICRHIHVVDGFGPEEQSCQIRRRVWLRRFALAGSDVVLPSRTLVDIATNTWKLGRKHIRYVPNGIDLSRFAAAAAAPRSADVPVIGTVAALRAEKNIARLLRAVARMTVPARVVIVGDGAERVALTELASSLGLHTRVTFTGHREDTPTLYEGFDIFALSSDTEQMPLSLMEAMASGLPVAATNVGDVRTMVADENLPLVGSLTDEALAASLSSLAAEPALRHRLGAANLAKARRDFDQDAMFAAWRALWSGTAPAT